MRTTITREPDPSRRPAADARAGPDLRAGCQRSDPSWRSAIGTPAGIPDAEFNMGAPIAPLEKAIRLAAELEDEALLRKLAVRR